MCSLRRPRVIGRVLGGSAFVILLLPRPAFASPWLMGLGDLPGGAFASAAFDVSADGRVVVGIGRSEVFHSSPTEGFRWTAETGMQSIGDLPGGARDSRGYAASADGSVVVGTSSGGSGNQAVRWSEETGLVGLGDLPGGSFYSQARAVSADGSVVGGASSTDRGDEAFIWTAARGMMAVGDLPGGGASSFVHDLSADGTIAVGGSAGASGYEAFLWTEAGGTIGLGDLPEGGFSSTALAVSADGMVVVGRGESALGIEAFRWTASEGMQGLGHLEEEPFGSSALDVSSDGSVVVGNSWSAAGYEAFVWNERRGMRRLQDVLEGLGLDLTGWTLDAARGVSEDGTVIAGSGTNPSGDREAWVARIPMAVDIDIRPWSDPNSIDPMSHGLIPVALLGSEGFDVAGVDVTTLAFGPGEAAPLFDLTDPWVFLLSHWDVNRDGEKDLLSYYRAAETGIAVGDTEACLTGETLDGVSFEGCDAVSTMMPPWGCGLGSELPLLLPPLMWLMQRRRARLPAMRGHGGEPLLPLERGAPGRRRAAGGRSRVVS